MSTNILIIEDVNNKITSLGNAIKEKEKVEIFPKNEEIDEFITKMSAAASESSSKLKEWINDELINYLGDNDIDLIILDFYLYKNEEQDNKRIDSSSGYKILEEIRKSPIKNIPIFANSFKNDSLLATNDSYLSTIAGIIEKKSDKSEYDDYFKRNIFLINRMVLLGEGYKKEKIKSDIVIICALKKEIEPVINLLKEPKKNQSGTLAIGHMETKEGKKFKVVAITKEQMGMAEAATLTTQMIEKYNPNFVVMTGIAAGISKGDQKFLDIIMPKNIYNWQSGKYKVINDSKEGEKAIHAFERTYDPQKTYIDNKTTLNISDDYLKEIPEEFLIQEGFEGDFANDDDIVKYYKKIQTIQGKNRSEFKREIIDLYKQKKEKLEKEIEENEKNSQKIKELKEELENFEENKIVIEFIKYMTDELECNIHKEGMVSGSAVVADGYIVEKNIRQRKVNGIDMESYGVAYACNHSDNKPNVIILKAICDFADNEKNDVYQSAAAYVSAQAFYKLFTEYIDMESKS